MCPPNEFLRFLRTVMNLRISTPHRNVWTPGVQRNHQVFNPSSSSLVTPPVWGDRSQMVCTHLTLLGAPVFLWGCSRLFIPLWMSEPGMSFQKDPEEMQGRLQLSMCIVHLCKPQRLRNQRFSKHGTSVSLLVVLLGEYVLNQSMKSRAEV